MKLGLFELFTGYKVLDELHKATKSNVGFQESKMKALNSFHEFYASNQEFFGPRYTVLIRKEEMIIRNATIKNCSSVSDEVSKFIDEMEFHLIATSGFRDIVRFIENYPKEKMKPGFCDNCIQKYNRILDSYIPSLTLEYFDDFMNYLDQNNVKIQNREDVRKQLLDKLNSFC